jgi:glycosyltransferase involved in cell wall biosynthesis
MTGNESLLLSILIPTLESRRTLCDRLCRHLEQQVKQNNVENAVEILALRDDGSATVGSKRNQLMKMARGRFIVFVDDDDRVSDDYVEQITRAINENPDSDCIGFAAEITFQGKYPRKMVHSIRYKDWRHSDGQYVRPPCHITPIRRSIATRYAFADIDYAEDMDWTLRMSRDEAISREATLDVTLYFYDCRRYYAVQWVLDRSQPLRHALGLRFVRNR